MVLRCPAPLISKTGGQKVDGHGITGRGAAAVTSAGATSAGGQGEVLRIMGMALAQVSVPMSS
jgi:hypothetical protein